MQKLKGFTYNVIQQQNKSDDIANLIFQFEENVYQQKDNDNLVKVSLPYSKCISLQTLIDAIVIIQTNQSLSFIIFSKNQFAIVSLEILQHLLNLHTKNVAHGSLIPKNIFIEFQNENLTFNWQEIHIKKIYFVRYKVLEDEQYQQNGDYLEQDVKQLLNTLKLLQCAILKHSPGCKFLQQFSNFDLLQQKNQKYEQNLIEIVIKNLKTLFFSHYNYCHQLETGIILYQNNVNQNELEYFDYPGYLQPHLRKKNLIAIQKFLKNLGEYQLNTTLINFNNSDNNSEEILNLGDENNRLFYDFIEGNLRLTIIKNFWIFLQNKFYNQIEYVDEYFDEYIKEQNFKLKKFYQESFKMIKGINKIIVKDINDHIESNIYKHFKFEMNIDKTILDQVILKECKVQFQEGDVFDQKYIQQYQENVRNNAVNQLKYYCELLLQQQILELIKSLI